MNLKSRAVRRRQRYWTIPAGTPDTPAVPMDQINNPGIVNTAQRPTVANELVARERKVNECAEEPSNQCW